MYGKSLARRFNGNEYRRKVGNPAGKGVEVLGSKEEGVVVVEKCRIQPRHFCVSLCFRRLYKGVCPRVHASRHSTPMGK